MGSRDKQALIKILVWYGIFSSLNDFWVMLENLIYGHPIPNCADTVIGLIATCAMYKLLMSSVHFIGFD